MVEHVVCMSTINTGTYDTSSAVCLQSQYLVLICIDGIEALTQYIPELVYSGVLCSDAGRMGTVFLIKLIKLVLLVSDPPPLPPW